MRIKHILNQIQKQPGFVYVRTSWVERGGRRALRVELRPRAVGRAACSGCGRRCRGYDRMAEREYAFVPLWNLPVVFAYAPRRVECGECGVRVEAVPWAEGRSRQTTAYAWFLARWARRLGWQGTAQAFGASWDTVVRAVRTAVAWGLAHRCLDGVGAIGIDEIAWKQGHRYATLVYQIDEGSRRLLWIGRERTGGTLRRFFAWFGPARCAGLRFVCSDMWRPYLDAIAECAAGAVNILDRFHVMSHLSKAIDEVRARETRDLKQRGRDPVLTRTRWCLLKRPENLTDAQRTTLRELLRCNLRTVRAYLLKEDFQWFWTYISPAWAGKFLDGWCTRVMRSRLDPMKKVAKMLRAHRGLLLNWFRARKHDVALGVVEGFNNKARVTTKRAYGFRSFDMLELALYHTLADLPEPYVTHTFC